MFVAALGTLVLGGCDKSQGEAGPVPPTVPAQRAAQSFIHCVEIDGGACVDNHPEFGAYDAFSILGWLASGSPTSILEALPRELQHHQTERSIQQRFVSIVDARAMRLRGAECMPEQAVGFNELVPKLTEAVEQRMTRMGLWGADLERVVGALAQEAREGLADGYLVTMRCQSDPWRVYMATTAKDGRYIVVGMMGQLPEFLGGDAPARDANTGRLRSIDLGRASPGVGTMADELVHPWVQIPIQEF